MLQFNASFKNSDGMEKSVIQLLNCYEKLSKTIRKNLLKLITNHSLQYYTSMGNFNSHFVCLNILKKFKKMFQKEVSVVFSFCLWMVPIKIFLLNRHNNIKNHQKSLWLSILILVNKSTHMYLILFPLKIAPMPKISVFMPEIKEALKITIWFHYHRYKSFTIVLNLLNCQAVCERIWENHFLSVIQKGVYIKSKTVVTTLCAYCNKWGNLQCEYVVSFHINSIWCGNSYSLLYKKSLQD